MCGIYAVVARNGRCPDEAHLRRVCSLMRHRGPDEEGIKTIACESVGVALAHTRLSVIDLQTGSQPMSNEDGSLWIVYNGEIYNFREIRAELEENHQFRTNSDTEVILHAYEEYGADCLKRFNGMFAFAIWDTRTRTLFAARDRLGQKPLFYHNTGDFLVLASSIEAILATPGVPGMVDWGAVSHYFTYQYVPAPATAFREVSVLPPAHFLMGNDRGTRRVRYWRPDYWEKTCSSFLRSREALRELLSDAVRLRLVSDVPLGAFLSGGIDSSITVGLMARHHSGPVRTFSIGFSHEKYDERPFARAVAEKFETEHTEFEVGPGCIDALAGLMKQYGQPFADSSALPTYYLAKQTREHVTVALCGDGGDESFGGYDRYGAMKLGRLYDRIPRVIKGPGGWLLKKVLPAKTQPRTISGKIRRFLDVCQRRELDRYLAMIEHLSDSEKNALVPGARSSEYPSSDLPLNVDFMTATAEDLVEKIMEVDLLNYLPDDVLVKVDVASMASSLEVRSPFLDHRIVEFAASLPLEWKMRGTLRRQSKYILKSAFDDILSREIVNRPKMGFGIPLAPWFRDEWAGHAHDLLLDRTARERGIFDSSAVEALLDDHVQSKADNAYKLWNLMCFESWMREVVDGG